MAPRYPTQGVPCSPSHVITSYVDLLLRNMTLLAAAPGPQTTVTFISRVSKERTFTNEPVRTRHGNEPSVDPPTAGGGPAARRCWPRCRPRTRTCWCARSTWPRSPSATRWVLFFFCFFFVACLCNDTYSRRRPGADQDGPRVARAGAGGALSCWRRPRADPAAAMAAGGHARRRPQPRHVSAAANSQGRAGRSIQHHGRALL